MHDVCCFGTGFLSEAPFLQPSFYEALSAWATLSAALVVAAASAVALMQLKEATRARRLQSILAIFRYVDDADLRRARWFAYQHIDAINKLLVKPFSSEWERRKQINKLIHRLSDGAVDLQRFDLALNAMNNVAYLIRDKQVPYEAVVPANLQTTFLRVHCRFEPYIKYRRSGKTRFGLPMNEPSLYACHLIWIVEEIERRRRNREQWQLLCENVMEHPVGTVWAIARSRYPITVRIRPPH